MPGPQELIAQLMAAQGGAPGSQGMPMPMQPPGPAPTPPGSTPIPPTGPAPMPAGPPPPGNMPPGVPPDIPVGASDEEMLGQVSDQMGGGTPPPTGGMKWVSLEADQQALMNDPSPENIQAFIDYWGEEKLPPGLEAGGGAKPEAPEADENE